MSVQEHQVEIGRRIRAARTRKDLSLRSLARRLYLSEGTIRAYESGKAAVSAAMLVAIANELDVWPSELIDPRGLQAMPKTRSNEDLASEAAETLKELQKRLREQTEGKHAQ